jgi:hypothetical protein
MAGNPLLANRDSSELHPHYSCRSLSQLKSTPRQEFERSEFLPAYNCMEY